MSGLRIGWSQIDTTPERTVDLSGQYYHRLSRGIHSRLSATVLALESGTGEQCVMASLDLAGFQADFQEDLRASLGAELSDLNRANILLNAIHTHNAPGVDPVGGLGWLEEPPEALSAAEYRKFLLRQLTRAIVEAWQSRKPGGIAGALSHARVGHCRRAVYSNGTAEMYGDTGRDDFLGLEGGEDSGVDLLFTFDKEERPTGVIVNLACPSQVMESTYQISSDFMGETRRLLRQRFGEDFHMLGQISAAGCQSPRDLARRYKGEPDFWHGDGVAEIGRRLSQAVEQVFPQARAKIEYSPRMHHDVRPLALPKRRVSYGDFLAAEKQVKELESVLPEAEAYRQFCADVTRNEAIPNRPGPYDSKLHPFVLIQNHKAVLERYHEQDQRPCFEMEFHVVRLGNIVLVTNPFELYLDFGHRIKARSVAEQTFIVQLCCGSGGYLPNDRAERLGGYGGLVINGLVGSDGGMKLVDETVNAIKEQWK